MWISEAYAAAKEEAVHLDALSEAPSAFEAFMTNLGLLAVLVLLFYVLLVLPQKRRFQEHSKMLSNLRKGDKVITGGGFIGKVDRIIDEQEVVIDLGNGIKVTALRSTIQNKGEAKDDPVLKPERKKPEDEGKGKKDKKSAAENVEE